LHSICSPILGHYLAVLDDSLADTASKGKPARKERIR